MMKLNATPGTHLAYKELKNLQLLLGSVIPVAAILLIGAYATQNMDSKNVLSFCIIFLLCALATYLGERKVIQMMQHALNKQYLDLATTCREFLSGKEEKRATIVGNDELTNLAQFINILLDLHLQLIQRINSAPPPAPPAPPVIRVSPQNNEATLLKQQLRTMLDELGPIVNGDLRVKTSVSDGIVGVIADTCNSLIEELAQFAKWTRYAAQVVMTSSQNILDRSIEMAKTTENQMHRLSQTTNNVEEIVAFIQRLSNTLHLSVDVAKEIHAHLQEKISDPTQIVDAPLLQLSNETQRQTELLEGILDSTEETSKLAESLIGDLYNVAQQIHQSSIGVLKTAERINELAMLAERWQAAAAAFTIEEEEEEAAMKAPWLL